MIAFTTSHSALFAERQLQGKFSILLMPSLRSLAATCGISIRFRPADLPAIARELAALALPPDDYTIYGVHHDGIIEGYAEDAGERAK